MGAPGAGKNHVAVALGLIASRNTFSVQGYALDDLVLLLKGDTRAISRIRVAPDQLRARRRVARW